MVRSREKTARRRPRGKHAVVSSRGKAALVRAGQEQRSVCSAHRTGSSRCTSDRRRAKRPLRCTSMKHIASRVLNVRRREICRSCVQTLTLDPACTGVAFDGADHRHGLFSAVATFITQSHPAPRLRSSTSRRTPTFRGTFQNIVTGLRGPRPPPAARDYPLSDSHVDSRTARHAMRVGQHRRWFADRRLAHLCALWRVNDDLTTREHGRACIASHPPPPPLYPAKR